MLKRLLVKYLWLCAFLEPVRFIALHPLPHFIDALSSSSLFMVVKYLKEIYANYTLKYCFTGLVRSPHSRNIFGCSKQLFSSKLLKPTAHYLLSTKKQTDTVNDEQMNTVEQLEEKGPHIFTQELVEPETKLK